jgi:hypothetical protein
MHACGAWPETHVVPKNTTGIPAEKRELYEKLLATKDSVERKGVIAPYASRDGHMFSFLTTQGTLAHRLPAAGRERFLEEHSTKLCVQQGRVIKEYVEVPEHLLRDTAELESYFETSCNCIGSLKPKPSKRKPAAKR